VSAVLLASLLMAASLTPSYKKLRVSNCSPKTFSKHAQ